MFTLTHSINAGCPGFQAAGSAPATARLDTD